MLSLPDSKPMPYRQDWVGKNLLTQFSICQAYSEISNGNNVTSWLYKGNTRIDFIPWPAVDTPPMAQGQVLQYLWGQLTMRLPGTNTNSMRDALHYFDTIEIHVPNFDRDSIYKGTFMTHTLEHLKTFSTRHIKSMPETLHNRLIYTSKIS